MLNVNMDISKLRTNGLIADKHELSLRTYRVLEIQDDGNGRGAMEKALNHKNIFVNSRDRTPQDCFLAEV